MKAVKNLLQLTGIGCIGWALYTAWQGLPVKDAVLGSLATLTAVKGPQTNLDMIAHSLPQRLFASPWLLVGISMVLIPYIIEMLVRALPAEPSHARRY